MTELGDFPLHEPPEQPARRQGSRLGPLVAVALLLGAAAAGIVYRMSAGQGEEAAPPSPAVTEIPVTPEPDAVPDQVEAGGPEKLVLPLLGESDALLRDLASALSSHPELAAWLVTDGLIRTFTVAVENIANGQNPAQRLPALAPKGEFRTARRGDEVFIDQRSYDRYNRHGDLVASLDADGAARLYATFSPLIAEAYRDLGHPEGGFDETLERAISRLLDTPVVEREVVLIPRPVYDEFADPSLEALSPVQKQLLGMGPRNVRLVQAKLRELATGIGIPEERLPTPVVIVH